MKTHMKTDLDDPLRPATIGDLKELIKDMPDNLPVFFESNMFRYEKYNHATLALCIKRVWLCHPVRSNCWETRTKAECKRIKEHCEGVTL